MDEMPQNNAQAVMQVPCGNELDLPQCDPTSCEIGEKKKEKGKDGKRKLIQNCMSEPQVHLKKLAAEVSETQPNGSARICSLSSEEEESCESEDSENPASVQTTQENQRNCEATEETRQNSEMTSQEHVNSHETDNKNVSNCEMIQRSVNNSETSAQKSVSNSETSSQKSLNDSEKVQESTSNSEATLQNIRNCKAEVQETESCSESNQKSISKLETAEDSVSNCKLSPGEQHIKDEESLKQETSDPRVLLTGVATDGDDSSSDYSLPSWGSRLRVRRAIPPPPPSPPEEELYPVAVKERPVTRTVALKKVNYCELYSSDEDEPGSNRRIPVRKHLRQTTSSSSSSEEFSMSEENYSSDDSRIRRKKRAAQKAKQQAQKSEGSDSEDDYKPQKRESRPKKVRQVKEENLSEYEQLRRKNIEEKLAFLESLKFDEMKQEFPSAKKSKTTE